jgi:UDP-glucose:(heptosyl)LPS alpha-1,3-glucosyltransferase
VLAEPTPVVTLVANDIRAVGGMERHLSVLIAGLLDAGHEVRVLARTCELPPHPRLRWIRVPGPLRPFPLAHPWFVALASLKLWRHRAGIVHTTGAIVLNRVDFITVHLCHHATAEERGLVRSLRTTRAYRLNARLSAWISRLGERWSYRPTRAGGLVGVSPGVERELARHFPAMAERTSSVPNGVDTTSFRPDDAERSAARHRLALTESQLAALFVGSEWEGKGLRYAIEALRRAPAWVLLVLGEGDTPRFERLARRWGVEDRVRFLPATPNPLPLYQAVDAFVLPSAYETFSLATYEAAACGLPLLATRVSGIEDLLVDGENGWFIEREATAIADRLRALESPEIRRRLARAARGSSGGFGWERMIEGYLDLYASLTPEVTRVPAGPAAAPAAGR